jgi:hypothetical protein
MNKHNGRLAGGLRLETPPACFSASITPKNPSASFTFAAAVYNLVRPRNPGDASAVSRRQATLEKDLQATADPAETLPLSRRSRNLDGVQVAPESFRILLGCIIHRAESEQNSGWNRG